MDAADLAEAAEALLPDLDVEMDLVVEGPLPFIEFREPERVPRDPEGREVESLDGEQMVDVPGRQAPLDDVFGGDLVRGRLVLLRGPRDANALPGRGVEGHEVPERRGIEEDLQFRLEEFPHPIGPLPRADFVAVRPADDC